VDEVVIVVLVVVVLLQEVVAEVEDDTEADLDHQEEQVAVAHSVGVPDALHHTPLVVATGLTLEVIKQNIEVGKNKSFW
jgi:hypothetical protein